MVKNQIICVIFYIYLRALNAGQGIHDEMPIGGEQKKSVQEH